MPQENSHLVYVKTTSLNFIVSQTIGQHLRSNLQCFKTCKDDNFWIIRQARLSFHLSFLKSVYIKTQTAVLCRQNECFLTGTLQVNIH